MDSNNYLGALNVQAYLERSDALARARSPRVLSEAKNIKLSSASTGLKNNVKTTFKASIGHPGPGDQALWTVVGKLSVTIGSQDFSDTFSTVIYARKPDGALLVRHFDLSTRSDDDLFEAAFQFMLQRNGLKVSGYLWGLK
jgi:hypothetical protein